MKPLFNNISLIREWENGDLKPLIYKQLLSIVEREGGALDGTEVYLESFLSTNVSVGEESLIKTLHLINRDLNTTDILKL